MKPAIAILALLPITLASPAHAGPYPIHSQTTTYFTVNEELTVTSEAPSLLFQDGRQVARSDVDWSRPFCLISFLTPPPLFNLRLRAGTVLVSRDAWAYPTIPGDALRKPYLHFTDFPESSRVLAISCASLEVPLPARETIAAILGPAVVPGRERPAQLSETPSVTERVLKPLQEVANLAWGILDPTPVGPEAPPAR